MIYLDNSATTKPYKEVIDSFAKVTADFWGNPSSLHGFGGKSEKLLAQAREQVAGLLGVKATEIIFTSGGSESNNLAIKGIAENYRNRGKHIITTSIEHPSVKRPFEQLKELGYDVTYLPVNQDGRVEIEQVKEAIREDTILVSVMHVNNEVGTVQPIYEIGHFLKSYPKIHFHVDGVQGFGKVELSLRDAHIDLYSLSGHKFHGLKGTGILFAREGITLSPLIAGGNQERGMRSGTESLAGAVSLAKAMRLAIEKSRDGSRRMNEYRTLILQELSKMENVVINSPIEHAAPHIINFSIPGLKSETFVHTLGEFGIYVSTNSACSSKKKTVSQTLLAMGKNEQIAGSSIRISLDYDHSKEEIEQALKEIERAIQMLSEVRKK
ncbi:cysteine desulfurase [Pradoshia sp. D12]|uniref:cysteine desulfurase family protein n=1 Tax=Bacillaceae TaxID=186817 RepID=UPI00080AD705|nr:MULTISPECIES: cysteine desulfurase family protein [Bacillaceae]OCA81850.1 cysteine desulfurase [Bacillus sp. FJAT-27986]QFK72523.1 cysteine desulfurase [Pradoshia sp. D12]TPF70733.1 cysteine desulfurase [Bacillus sp. D12]